MEIGRNSCTKDLFDIYTRDFPEVEERITWPGEIVLSLAKECFLSLMDDAEVDTGLKNNARVKLGNIELSLGNYRECLQYFSVIVNPDDPSDIRNADDCEIDEVVKALLGVSRYYRKFGLKDLQKSLEFAESALVAAKEDETEPLSLNEDALRAVIKVNVLMGNFTVAHQKTFELSNIVKELYSNKSVQYQELLNWISEIQDLVSIQDIESRWYDMMGSFSEGDDSDPETWDSFERLTVTLADMYKSACLWDRELALYEKLVNLGRLEDSHVILLRQGKEESDG